MRTGDCRVDYNGTVNSDLGRANKYYQGIYSLRTGNNHDTNYRHNDVFSDLCQKLSKFCDTIGEGIASCDSKTVIIENHHFKDVDVLVVFNLCVEVGWCRANFSGFLRRKSILKHLSGVYICDDSCNDMATPRDLKGKTLQYKTKVVPTGLTVF